MVPISSYTLANGPYALESPSSRSGLYELVMITEPSQDAEATTRPEPGSNRTVLTDALCNGLPRGGSSVCDWATQKLSSTLYDPTKT